VNIFQEFYVRFLSLVRDVKTADSGGLHFDSESNTNFSHISKGVYSVMIPLENE